MIGDAKNLPTLLASSNFSGFAVIGQFPRISSYHRILRETDADPYIPNGWGSQWFANQNNLFGLLISQHHSRAEIRPVASAPCGT